MIKDAGWMLAAAAVTGFVVGAGGIAITREGDAGPSDPELTMADGPDSDTAVLVAEAMAPALSGSPADRTMAELERFSRAVEKRKAELAAVERSLKARTDDLQRIVAALRRQPAEADAVAMAVSAAVAEAVARAESEAQARAESEAREAFAAAAAAYGSAAPELQQVSLMLTRRRGELAEVERTLSERSAELNMMVASLHDRSISPELDPELVTTEAASTKPVADFADLDADLAKIREVLHPGLGRTEPAALTAPDTALTLVLFDSGSATLSMGGRTRIMAAAEALTAIGPTRVRIQAHTDTLGSAEGNARLARARAEAVATVFVEAGMDREMIDIAALGETADALPVATPDGVSEPLNRRVGVYTVPTTS